MDLLDRKLILVTGKGGVGKSAVSAALGLEAARRGRRVLVTGIEARDAIGPRLGLDPATSTHPSPTDEEGLHIARFDPDGAALRFFRTHLPSRTMARLLHGSRLWRTIYESTPGLKDIVVSNLIRRVVAGEEDGSFDHVIVDTAATGHLEAIYAAVDTAASVFGGPIGREGDALRRLFTDPSRTRVHVVALPEQMSVLEARDVRERAGQRDIPLGALVVNDVPRPLGTSGPLDRAGPVDLPTEEVDGALGEGASAVLRQAARLATERTASAAEAIEAARTIDLPMVLLPSVEDAVDDRDVVRGLAGALERPDPALDAYRDLEPRPDATILRGAPAGGEDS